LLTNIGLTLANTVGHCWPNIGQRYWWNIVKARSSNIGPILRPIWAQDWPTIFWWHYARQMYILSIRPIQYTTFLRRIQKGGGGAP